MSNFLDKYKISHDKFTEKLKDVTVNLQDADENTVVFYRITDSENAVESFKKRLRGVTPGLLIINKAVDGIESYNFAVVDYLQWPSLKKELCDQFYPKSMGKKIIGVTGTNGKSTVVHLCQQILNDNGLKTMSIGTVGVYANNEIMDEGTGTTTPAYVDLRRLLHKFDEYDYCCIEVSSHALVQKRLLDVKLAATAWTNISQDHLDFHKTMDEYFAAKKMIVDMSDTPLIIPYGEEDLENSLRKNGVKVLVSERLEVDGFSDSFKLDYNQKNLSLAKLLCEQVGGKELKIKSSVEVPKGRYTTQRINNSIYVVDYAHTPAAIENVLRETKSSFSDYRLITVFGCGGDRDTKKRPLMLDAAMKYSDHVVVTTDNPRTEDPHKIIEDIVTDRFYEDGKVTVNVDRGDAIADVVKDYEQKTIVVIAGKGHEEYQEVNGVKHHFSDIEEVAKNLERLK
jgi:UDP-N-acetylmuramoyl-L-alanyl-D-glutamate--2,6-diaminopimelate ligase